MPGMANYIGMIFALTMGNYMNKLVPVQSHQAQLSCPSMAVPARDCPEAGEGGGISGKVHFLGDTTSSLAGKWEFDADPPNITFYTCFLEALLGTAPFIIDR